MTLLRHEPPEFDRTAFPVADRIAQGLEATVAVLQPIQQDLVRPGSFGPEHLIQLDTEVSNLTSGIELRMRNLKYRVSEIEDEDDRKDLGEHLDHFIGLLVACGRDMGAIPRGAADAKAQAISVLRTCLESVDKLHKDVESEFFEDEADNGGNGYQSS